MITPSVLDLTFATQGIVNKIEDWQTIPDLGSDHFGVLFTITSNQVSHPTVQRFNTKNIEWGKFIKGLQNAFNSFSYNIDSKYSIQELDQLGELFTRTIVETANQTIPKSKVSTNSKPWWNEDLKALRKEMQRLNRLAKASEYTLFQEELKDAKNQYFNTVKIAKTKHWNKFLEKEDTQSIFKAMSYTKGISSQLIPSLYNSDTKELESTFQNKCNIFRSTLFPTPPSSTGPNLEVLVKDSSYLNSSREKWEWPSLTQEEVKRACTSKIKGKTPGPDLITQDIIVQAYLAVPHIFYIVYSILINQGYHPKIWKQATGFILKKPKKPDYSKPKAYRVISLLNCLGKVSERILAQRLSFLAETTSLLHNSQIGSRLYKSAIDAALVLQNEVEVNKANKLKTSVLFLDVKGAFDHVAKNRLLQVLVQLKLPICLVLWVKSFVEDRIIRLSFNNETEAFQPLNTGIPQGSPISPILFLIYIRDLFMSQSIKPLSYMDDISLIAASKSFKTNIKILEREATKLVELGTEYCISFDIEKTELIHFSNSKNDTLLLTLPNKTVLAPSRLVRWLGIYFDSSLKFKEHRSIRTSEGKQMLNRLNRLTTVTKGLSSFAIRQLYLACITSVTDYGSELWWKVNSKINLKPLQAIQNQGNRKILGVFKTAPSIPMELEAALPPPQIRLNHKSRRYILRVLKLSSKHPVKELVDKVVEDIREEVQFEEFNPSSTTQIESLVKSIYSLVDLDYLEEIRHFYFPP